MVSFYLYMSMKNCHFLLDIICEIVTTMNLVKEWYKGFHLILSQKNALQGISLRTYPYIEYIVPQNSPSKQWSWECRVQ